MIEESCKYIVSYKMYEHLLEKLLENIKMTYNLENFKYIYGIPRGGLPIAVHLSHFLKLKFLETQDLNNLSDEEKEKVLVVDDISDTGKTLMELTKHHNIDFTTATLFVKDRSKFVPDSWVENNNDWIVFPFEMLDEEPNREGYK